MDPKVRAFYHHLGSELKAAKKTVRILEKIREQIKQISGIAYDPDWPSAKRVIAKKTRVYRKRIKKVCKFCGKNYRAKREPSMYCSKQCRFKANKAKLLAAQYKANKEKTKGTTLVPGDPLTAGTHGH